MAIEKPNRMPIPPISATSGLESLCMSFPTISAFFSLLISDGIAKKVTINAMKPQPPEITSNCIEFKNYAPSSF